MVGVLLSDYLPSQLTDEVTKFLQEVRGYLFLDNNISPCPAPVFPSINIHDFIGDLWVFDLDHAKTALRATSPITVHFFRTGLGVA